MTLFGELCRTVIWDKNNTSPQGLQDVAAALEKWVTVMMCSALTQTSGGVSAVHALIPVCFRGEDEEEKESNGRKEATVMKE